MENYFCLHGHFYQPPRENPGLDEVEVQDSAYPFHDWNERVTAECYAPNSAARILDSEGRITKIVNNYRYISFDFGPTLLIWLERHRPDVYEKILEADRLSVTDHQGHGNAMAQIYNHVIMPLASRRDKETQVIWGIKDFEHRFKRIPEGMWLSETAVDLETLEILADHGIKFTILSPYQAKKIRTVPTELWQEVSSGRIDPTRAYRCPLRNGKAIDIFFYDGPISFSIAFDDSLWHGEALVHKIMAGFSRDRGWPQLVSVATDGESYGHHRKFGEMTLAYALQKIQKENILRLTNYGEYLALQPAVAEVEIHENTAWSCAHGVGRWKEDCGCRFDQGLGWNQKWRKPLREGLDQLNSTVSRHYESQMHVLGLDPWKMRNDYIDTILNRNGENVLSGTAKGLSPFQKSRVVKLLEIQRQILLMYTSCGWFFDDISGLEATQILSYADRAIQLTTPDLPTIEEAFLESLSHAKSNIKEFGTGKDIFLEFVKVRRVDFERIIAHWVMTGLFDKPVNKGSFFSHVFEVLSYHHLHREGTTFVDGVIKVTSQLISETRLIRFVMLHSGGPEFHCLTEHSQSDMLSDDLINEMKHLFHEGKSRLVLSRLEKISSVKHWTFRDLFLDERRKILNLVTEESSAILEESLGEFYRKNHKTIECLRDEEIPLPHGYEFAVQYVLERQLQRLVRNWNPMIYRELEVILQQCKDWHLSLDLTSLVSILEQELSVFFKKGDYDQCLKILQFSRDSGVRISLWPLQNLFWETVVTSQEHPLSAHKNLQKLAVELGFCRGIYELQSSMVS